LYNWKTAINACPNGWRLPSDNEWQELADLAGGNEKAGKHLKAKSGWEKGNGKDTYGFAALPGGMLGGINNYIGKYGHWWTATESDLGGTEGSAWYRGMHSANNNIGTGTFVKESYLFSVRCIKN
jgi:uncharacterized protein (TIGR02145 family)